ncbi:MAG: hypothetical protein HY366_01110 [Candidatus Aenigmarchaeota archaeon]|nr:hypothetical protein [Candidatus Aenigmarchaeota archaeon]
MRSMKCGDCGSTGPFMLLEATAAAQLKPRATGDPNARPPHYRFATKLIGVSVALVTLLVLMLLLRR